MAGDLSAPERRPRTCTCARRLFLSRSSRAAERAVAAGDHNQAARQLRRWAWGIGLIVLLLVVATWDMVFKPGT